jgi:acetoin utilization protein AcuB
MKITDLKVGDYMTPEPITVAPDDSLMHALETLRLRNVRRLPVALGNVLVGFVTAGDLKRAEPSTLSDSQEHFEQVMEGTPVSRIMVHDPVTTSVDTPLIDAAQVLLATKYGGLPVVDGGHLVGILTDNDLIRALVEILRAVGSAPQPAGG